MKRKIGELRNIPIVEGDKNLVREGTEIHINDLQSKGSSGGSGGMLYLKYNGQRDFMYVANNPCASILPVIAGVAIYDGGEAVNTIRSYYYNELYRKSHRIEGFGEMAIPKTECILGNDGLEKHYILNTTSLENIYQGIAEIFVDESQHDSPITFEEALIQVKEMFKDWEECSEEEFYEIFNQYR